MTDLAISWLLARPQICTVIVGATKVEQVEQNARFSDWTLTAYDLAEIDRILRTE